MKKNVIILALILSAVFARGQQLQNTYWTVYNPSGSFFQYFYFGIDSLSFSYDNINYTWRSFFTESGNQFVIHDNNGPGQCTPQDTGWYTFTIQNDTLDFTLITDQCAFSGRATVLGTYIFVRLYPTGIENISSDAVEIYPNPSMNGIFNLHSDGFEKIMVGDAQGRRVFEANTPGGKQNQSINLQQLSPGIYFVTLQNHNEKRVFKIINK
jgi:hypothetical protein